MVKWNVAKLAKTAGWKTAYRLAKETGISQPLAARMMRGAAVERIDVATLDVLASKFGVKPWELLDWWKR